MKRLTTLSLALGAALAFAGSAQAQIKMGVAGPLTPNAAWRAAQTEQTRRRRLNAAAAYKAEDHRL